MQNVDFFFPQNIERYYIKSNGIHRVSTPLIHNKIENFAGRQFDIYLCVLWLLFGGRGVTHTRHYTSTKNYFNL